ncbi:MAG TPA: F0F1 ATP synthase subunit A [Burkholderiales bacterium]|nr:F0F1 ATP synthase subunit A [Burkholderiales bacterium]
MAVEASGKNPIEYIQHHLNNWAVGSGGTGINLDTILFSVLVGGLLVLLAWRVGKRISVDRPGRVQSFLELIVTFVNQQVRDAFPVKDPFIGPLALTIFVWVLLMNAMDLIPVDLFPRIAQWIGMGFGLEPEHVYLRIVPTADVSTPFALALSIFVLTIIYGLRHRGISGTLKHYLTHPYGPWMAPFNLAMSILDELARPLSLALRLWGNMFAGELIFMLIALFGFSLIVAPGQVLLGWLWSWFETLVIVLQAFIFMLLSVVYLAMTVQQEH